ncbi:hypothetical protein BDN67DRAFT_974353 [Paxillus ammoniavirescens]|nr:hypothetical protein BDN67DRAFT_974353 [Paxillus ammoniavirescens]
MKELVRLVTAGKKSSSVKRPRQPYMHLTVRNSTLSKGRDKVACLNSSKSLRLGIPGVVSIRNGLESSHTGVIGSKFNAAWRRGKNTGRGAARDLWRGRESVVRDLPWRARPWRRPRHKKQ